MEEKNLNRATTIIALCALGLTFWQGHIQLKHNYKSLEPRINSYLKVEGKNQKIGIYLINNGLGPAYIENLQVTVDGEPIKDEGEWGKFYEALLKLKLSPTCFTVGGPRKNDSFSVGDEIFLIESNNNSEKHCALDNLLLVKYAKNRLNFTIKTKSIYDEKFEYQYQGNIQKQL
ncbi:hypothetical protein [Pseudomonas citronellolis]|uniref:hypothetical protein n=1 Tax=Pseudomonas citronellolis TaxID=53408 RepID=UPI003C2C4E73